MAVNAANLRHSNQFIDDKLEKNKIQETVTSYNKSRDSIVEMSTPELMSRVMI